MHTLLTAYHTAAPCISNPLRHFTGLNMLKFSSRPKVRSLYLVHDTSKADNSNNGNHNSLYVNCASAAKFSYKEKCKKARSRQEPNETTNTGNQYSIIHNTDYAGITLPTQEVA